jgi:hypothetical protein
MLFMALSGCSGSGESTEGDVKLATDSVEETGSFKKSNGEVCQMKVKLVASYPQSYKDSTSVYKLKKLFAQAVLNSTEDVGGIKEAMRLYAKSVITKNTPKEDNSSAADSIVDEIDIDRFELTVNVKVMYNSNGLISFCKEEAIDKNGQRTSTSHHYINFDLKEMKKVTLADLFRDDCIEKLTATLKAKLMDDQGAGNEDELNDLGYFNLPNLTVTNNFFFTSRGITWSYDASVIAVESVGEPTINIDYDDLEQFQCENSILKRL